MVIFFSFFFFIGDDVISEVFGGQKKPDIAIILGGDHKNSPSVHWHYHLIQKSHSFMRIF